MIKKLMACIREYKKATLLAPIFIIFEVIVECLIPLVIASLIDYINTGHNIWIIVGYGGALLLMAFCSLFFGVQSGKYGAIAGAGFAKNLRKDLFNKTQDFSFANIDKFSSSSLVTRLTTDVTNVQNAFMMIIRIAVRAPLMFIFAYSMTLTINVKMSLIILAVIPFLILCFFLIIKCAMPLFNRVFKKYDGLNNSIQENIKGMRVVKSFVREDFEIEKFKERTEDIKKDFIKAEKIVSLNGPTMNFFMYVATLAISIVGAFIIINTFKGIDAEGNYLWGELSTGQLSSLLTYTMQVLSSLMMVSFIFVMVTMSVASAKRIVEVLDETSTITNPENPILEVPNGDICFKDVSFKYRSDAAEYALMNINLNIKSGMTIGVIGGTGSSKTTLIQLISRLYDVSSGAVYVGGNDVRSYDIKALRDEVSVVLQKNVLFSGTIIDNLRWGKKDATLDEIKHVCDLACASEFIEQFPDKYETYIEQGGTNVSGGQKQRLCIARALLKKPKILILDDSTSAVDTKTDALIRKAFINEIPNTTKIIIAQRVASVMDSDMIIILDGGKVVDVGRNDELLQRSSIYQEIYETQNSVSKKEVM